MYLAIKKESKCHANQIDGLVHLDKPLPEPINLIWAPATTQLKFHIF